MSTRPIAASQARVCASAGESGPWPLISQQPVVRSKLGRPARVSMSTVTSRVIRGRLLTAGQADERRGAALTDRAGRFRPVD